MEEKVGILDIKARIDNSINCDVEIQVVDKHNIEKRILFYWSKMYNNSIKTGKDYDILEKAIVILISDFKMENLKEIEKYITKWNIREEEYQNVILTDVMEFYIIELPKFEKYKDKTNNNLLNSWVSFIKNSEVIDMSNKEIQKAKEVLEEISQDEHERYLAELRQKYVMDQKAVEDAGYYKGLKAGVKQVVKKLLEQNVDTKIISQATGLTKEEIEKIKEIQ